MASINRHTNPCAQPFSLTRAMGTLENVVKSWTLEDVVDNNLYADQLDDIPYTFTSFDKYVDCLAPFVAEELRANVRDNLTRLEDQRWHRLERRPFLGGHGDRFSTVTLKFDLASRPGSIFNTSHHRGMARAQNTTDWRSPINPLDVVLLTNSPWRCPVGTLCGMRMFGVFTLLGMMRSIPRNPHERYPDYSLPHNRAPYGMAVDLPEDSTLSRQAFQYDGGHWAACADIQEWHAVVLGQAAFSRRTWDTLKETLLRTPPPLLDLLILQQQQPSAGSLYGDEDKGSEGRADEEAGGRRGGTSTQGGGQQLREQRGGGEGTGEGGGKCERRNDAAEDIATSSMMAVDCSISSDHIGAVLGSHTDILTVKSSTHHIISTPHKEEPFLNIVESYCDNVLHMNKSQRDVILCAVVSYTRGSKFPAFSTSFSPTFSSATLTTTAATIGMQSGVCNSGGTASTSSFKGSGGSEGGGDADFSNSYGILHTSSPPAAASTSAANTASDDSIPRTRDFPSSSGTDSPGCTRTEILLVDGRSGAGKSYTAAALATVLSAQTPSGEAVLVSAPDDNKLMCVAARLVSLLQGVQVPQAHQPPQQLAATPDIEKLRQSGRWPVSTPLLLGDCVLIGGTCTVNSDPALAQVFLDNRVKLLLAALTHKDGWCAASAELRQLLAAPLQVYEQIVVRSAVQQQPKMPTMAVASAAGPQTPLTSLGAFLSKRLWYLAYKVRDCGKALLDHLPAVAWVPPEKKISDVGGGGGGLGRVQQQGRSAQSNLGVCGTADDEWSRALEGRQRITDLIIACTAVLNLLADFQTTEVTSVLEARFGGTMRPLKSYDAVTFCSAIPVGVSSPAVPNAVDGVAASTTVTALNAAHGDGHSSSGDVPGGQQLLVTSSTESVSHHPLIVAVSHLTAALGATRELPHLAGLKALYNQDSEHTTIITSILWRPQDGWCEETARFSAQLLEIEPYLQLKASVPLQTTTPLMHLRVRQMAQALPPPVFQPFGTVRALESRAAKLAELSAVLRKHLPQNVWVKPPVSCRVVVTACPAGDASNAKINRHIAEEAAPTAEPCSKGSDKGGDVTCAAMSPEVSEGLRCLQKFETACVQLVAMLKDMPVEAAAAALGLLAQPYKAADGEAMGCTADVAVAETAAAVELRRLVSCVRRLLLYVEEVLDVRAAVTYEVIETYCLSHTRVILSPATYMGRPRVQQALPPLAAIVVDDASHQQEAHLLIALGNAHTARLLVMLGDSMEPEVRVHSAAAARFGYGRSAFARLQTCGWSTMLLESPRANGKLEAKSNMDTQVHHNTLTTQSAPQQAALAATVGKTEERSDGSSGGSSNTASRDGATSSVGNRSDVISGPVSGTRHKSPERKAVSGGGGSSGMETTPQSAPAGPLWKDNWSEKATLWRSKADNKARTTIEFKISKLALGSALVKSLLRPHPDVAPRYREVLYVHVVEGMMLVWGLGLAKRVAGEWRQELQIWDVVDKGNATGLRQSLKRIQTELDSYTPEHLTALKQLNDPGPDKLVAPRVWYGDLPFKRRRAGGAAEGRGAHMQKE